jgi:hypothetical protein
MHHQINSYFSVLIITIAGSWAAYTIVDVATSDIFANRFYGSELQYTPLQKFLLGP